MGAPLFTWTAERKRELERLYLVEGLTGQEIADVFGPPCTSSAVRKMTTKLRLATRRDPSISRLRMLAGVVARWPAKPVRAPQASDAELIAAAIAAGKVTVLPAGMAAGLSALERQIWAAPPPVATWRQAIDREHLNARLRRERRAA